MTAKKKPTKKKASRTTGKTAVAKVIEEVIEDVHLSEIAETMYYDYALEVIEQRAIFATVDGLKPVARRILWAAYEGGFRADARYVKAAKISGDTMGNYHPHGDSSIYEAMATAVHAPLPMIDGSGNWGTMLDNPAAARYTEARLSTYSEQVFFDKFYLPCIDFVSNYDESRKEPLLLPALFPNALVNGNFGVAPGVQASTPAVVFDTLVKALTLSIKKGEATLDTCKGIDMMTTYGGRLHQSDTLKADMKRFLQTGQASFLFIPTYRELNSHSIRIEGFPTSSVAKALEKIAKIKGVAGVRDDSSKHDRNVAYVVNFQKSYHSHDLTNSKAQVVRAFAANVRYEMQVTNRYLNEAGEPESKLQPTTIPKVINSWLEYRVALEKRACKYWIEKRQIDIARLELMVLAVDNRDFIIKALGKKLDDDELAKYLAKGLKITVEQANAILDMKIRSLKALEKDKLLKQIKERKTDIKEFKGRIAKPLDYILGHVTEMAKKIAKAHASVTLQ
ncbi:DNA gyrase subunit A protein [Rhizobium phage RHph_N28_1]|nr:DNA gyrase subunit A protein [Rhizobium phage RHph_N28_1]QIG74191.1 DNA gyrase subunit A protein [Rhizobium phage RHph_N42]QXV73849.1 DNA gyrase subunit A protein [Rhizobium phage RHph_N46]